VEGGMRQALAKVLFTLAASNLVLAGCNKHADRKEGAAARPEPDMVSVEKEEAKAVVPGKMAADVKESPPSTEGYKDHGINAWVDASKDKLSTFAADVDTASYTIMRRKLSEGVLPPAAAVRVEEFVNYFRYAYAAPDSSRPFSVGIDAAPSPFNKGRHIVRVGVSTKAKSVSERKPANLVFLVDVSGSMTSSDKLDLAKRSLRILVDNLGDGDTVSLVTYAGSTRVVLEPTGLDQKNQILSAIEDLTAGGSTAMASGLDLAYQQALKGLEGDAISRVIVLSDGDANVGSSSHEDMLAQIASKVREGVTLSTIGFGMGNYKDETMEQLANKGNGNNFYIDTLSQAKRVFQEQLGATLEVVAQDVKLQVEFDSRQVARYRLVGYENRTIADDDFRVDSVDAGEIGSGHQVTAVYEIELKETMTADVTADDALATVRIRHKAPEGKDATEAAFTLTSRQLGGAFDGAASDFRFAFAVAAFAEVLRGSEDAEHWSLAEIRAIADAAAGADPDRKELVALIDKAIALSAGAPKKTAMAR
jgi:Ca-activated chloride channel homolog